jgi:gluconokinase
MIVILMGVSGSGKTTIGQAFATTFSWVFQDADSFHSAEAKAKMRQGIPLTDAERQPWLETLQNAIAQWIDDETNVVLACSALKSQYREILRCDRPQVKLIYLQGSYDLIAQRLRDRQGHFMKVDLLKSQFATLEEPSLTEAVYVDISKDLTTIIQAIKQGIGI